MADTFFEKFKSKPLISYRNETSYLLYMIPAQNVVRFRTGTTFLYRYHVNEYGASVGAEMKLVPVSCKHPLDLWVSQHSVLDGG